MVGKKPKTNSLVHMEKLRANCSAVNAARAPNLKPLKTLWERFPVKTEKLGV